jgi:hypothetical protein
MYNTMVMRREQSAQQPRTMFRGVNASLHGATSLYDQRQIVEKVSELKYIMHHGTKYYANSMSISTLNVTMETYRWPSNLFSIVVQHSSTIKYEEPSFPVGSQV